MMGLAFILGNMDKVRFRSDQNRILCSLLSLAGSVPNISLFQS